MTTINECLAELKTLFDAASLANGVYDYRTYPDKLVASVSLSYQGGTPEGSNASSGNSGFYDIMAVCNVQCDQTDAGTVTEAALRSAEQALNTIENNIHNLLGKGGAGNRGAYWLKVSFPSPSQRPPSAVEAPTNRLALVPFRVHLR